MNVGAILFGVGVLVGVVAYVAQPLFKRAPGDNLKRASNGTSFAELASRRDAIYALIRELDADFQTGKTNPQDYQTTRERYVAEGVALLKQLDGLSSSDTSAALDAEIEARVLALRQALTSPISLHRQSAGRFCTQCGQAAGPEDRFCGRCGAALKGIAAQ